MGAMAREANTMIKENPIKTTLAAGKASVGGWLNLGSPLAAEVLGGIGVPWMTVDCEHTPFDMNLTAHTFRAIEARGAIPLVRAWDHDVSTISRLLDAGAWGVVIPHVSTPEQAATFASATRYPPRGTRSVGTSRCITLGDTNEYYNVFNDRVLCIPQIEDMEGIGNAQAIAEIPDVDIGFLGPNDLSRSMGAAMGSDAHEKALADFREGCAAAGKPCGIPVNSGAIAKQRIAEGFSFISIANDLKLMREKADIEFEGFLE
ncbi:MAG: hypothetical protein CMJ49_07560 [Planctomycetaceae bacterium]|nr:hypothetical protein [Planctomycetaceae bacterium]